MKDATKKAVNSAIDSYNNGMIAAATDLSIEAHISGDIAAHAAMGVKISKTEVQREALLFGDKYKKLLKETGGTIIQGQRIDWMTDHTEDTRKAVYETIKSGLVEGKPVADIGGKLSVKGTVAYDLEKLVIRDSKYKYVRIARTETARIQNQGTLNRFKKNKITHVEVTDGDEFCEECAEANGQIWTIAYAADHELEHPNCTRSFSPVIPDDWVPPEEAKPIKRPEVIKKAALPDPSGARVPKIPTKKRPPKSKVLEVDADAADKIMKSNMYSDTRRLDNVMKAKRVENAQAHIDKTMKGIDFGVAPDSSIGEWRKATDGWLKANPGNALRDDVRWFRTEFLIPDKDVMKKIIYNEKKSKIQYLPKSSERFINNANSEMQKLTNKNFAGLSRVKIKYDPSAGRASWNADSQTMKIYGESKKKTVMHELGHVIEDGDVRFKREMTQFRASKASTTKPEKLSDIVKDPRYGVDEIAVRDDFIDPYAGRIYADGSTEMLALGLEQFSDVDKAIRLYINHPDHFDLIMRILK